MRLALLLVLLLLPATAHASDPPPATDAHPGLPFDPPTIPEGDDVRLTLRQGATTPFAGVLFDPPTLTRWTNRILWLQYRLTLEHDLHVRIEDTLQASHLQHVATLEQSYTRELDWTKTELTQCRADLRDTRAALARATAHPWRSFGLGMGTGAALILGAVITGAVLAHQ